MRKPLRTLLTALLLFCMLCQPLSVQAAHTLDPSRICSLTLDYSGVSGLEIDIHQIAAYAPDGTYALTGPFAGYPVKIHNITSQKEWRDVASTLVAYIAADGIAPLAADITDEAGFAHFSGLSQGLYLVLGVGAENAESSFTFENFCVFLPTPQDDGTLEYDVTAKPKHIHSPPPDEPKVTRYQVTKLWNDTHANHKRPNGVTVDILRNGAVYETVSLRPDNNWTYGWEVEENKGLWTVVEKDVPDGYTVVITSEKNSFTITNTYPTTPPGTPPPQTGDDFPLTQLLLIMAISGLSLVALGIWYKRNKK